MTNINDDDIYARSVADSDPDMVLINVPQKEVAKEPEPKLVADNEPKRELGVRSGKTHLLGHEPTRNLKLDLSGVENKASASITPTELPPRTEAEKAAAPAEPAIPDLSDNDDAVEPVVETAKEEKEPSKAAIDQSKLVELPSRADIEEEQPNEEAAVETSDVNDTDNTGEQTGDEQEGTAEEDDRVSREEYEKLEQRIGILTKDYETLKRRQIEALKEKELTANMNLAKVLLPIFDDLDKAIEYSSQNGLDTMDVAGIVNIRKKMVAALSNEGLSVIDPLGLPFDMNEHQAIEREQTEDEADMVTKVYQVGYKLHDKVIRPALVAVSY